MNPDKRHHSLFERGIGRGKMVAPMGPVLPTACIRGGMDISAQDKETLWSKYLLPGDLFATKVPHVISTVLGSCVAVCLWDPVLRAGGMNHFMLPSFPGQGEPTNRYGDISTRNLVMRMESLGSRRLNMKAWLYGGGNILGASVVGEEVLIGMKNVQAACHVLASEGLSIVGEHVGEIHGRKLKFNTYEGTLTIEFLNSLRSTKES